MSMIIARKFVRLAKTARAILDSQADDRTKYDLIFSVDISRAAHDTNLMPEYADPDTSYIEDVTAFVVAMEERAKAVQAAIDAVDAAFSETVKRSGDANAS